MLHETVAPHKLREQYVEQGYLGPIRVLSAEECRQFLMAANSAGHRAPLDWNKGHGATSRAFYEIANHPTLVDIVTAVLGDDVLLWGASIESRPPGTTHPWHSDIESSTASGTALSVWIGIEHTHRRSSLLLIPCSHRFGITVQEVRHDHGKGRAEVTNDDIVRWARKRDERSGLLNPEITNGEALFFDGRLWHASHNGLPETRRALLLQYATPDTAIHIPDLNYLDWPFHRLNVPRPACVMVRGSASVGRNRIVSAPVGGGTALNPQALNPQLTSRAYPLGIPLQPDEKKGWKPYPVFHGSTANVKDLTCHVSVLTHDHCPHPPHRRDEEEILLLLAGEADLVLPDLPSGANQRMRLKAGELVYYPAHFAHTLQTASDDPANYLMLKWRNPGAPPAASPLGFHHSRFSDGDGGGRVAEGFSVRGLFNGPTTSLRRLECHVSTLRPGAGYQPHIDAHDVALVVLEGEVETLGERLGPHAVIFCPAGEPHGLLNPGQVVARYVVFEFHGRQTQLLTDGRSPTPSLVTKLLDPQRWRRKLKRWLGRLRA